MTDTSNYLRKNRVELNQLASACMGASVYEYIYRDSWHSIDILSHLGMHILEILLPLTNHVFLEFTECSLLVYEVSFSARSESYRLFPRLGSKA
jgi:hypothetical protein